MLKEGLYTISNLQALIKESNEFKPKFGDKVVKDNAKNNDKAVGDIMKDVDKINKKVKKTEKVNKSNNDSKELYDMDLNKTMLDLEYKGVKPDSDRILDLAMGKNYVKNSQTPKTKNVKSNDTETVDYSGNEKFVNDRKKISQQQIDAKTNLKTSGLTSQKLPKQTFEPKTVFNNKKTNENKTMKRLHFKNTRFLSESQMLAKVPEDYKVDGNVFLMKDSTGAEYIIECTVDDNFNFAKFNVMAKPNKQAIQEEFNRMEKLCEYKSSDYNNGTSKQTENTKVSEMLDIMKNLKTQKQ